MAFFRSAKPKRASAFNAGNVDYRALRERFKKDRAEPQHLTKAEERAKRALQRVRERDVAASKCAVGADVSEHPLKALERRERRKKDALKAGRGTSVARMKRFMEEEEEEDVEKEEEMNEERELLKRAAQSRLGIASPLPRSILRPVKGHRAQGTEHRA
jgi:hypothetical protein